MNQGIDRRIVTSSTVQPVMRHSLKEMKELRPEVKLSVYQSIYIWTHLWL